MSDNLTRIKEIIIDKLGIEESKITTEARFIEDLGADSLDTVELIMQFEEEFEIASSEGKMEIPWQYFAALLPVKSVAFTFVAESVLTETVSEPKFNFAALIDVSAILSLVTALLAIVFVCTAPVDSVNTILPDSFGIVIVLSCVGFVAVIVVS